MRFRLLLAGWLVLWAVGTPAQEKPATLRWFFGLADLPNGEWGSIYHVYDSRQTLRFQLGFRNESNHSVQVTLNVAAAAEKLTWSDGSPWRGRSFPDLGAMVRVLKPETVAERRTYHLIESSAALRRGDTEAALRYAREVLRESPTEPAGHYALATVFLKVGRFREAIHELELLKPPRPEPARSLIYAQLAYCYLAIGDQQKAEATLREVHSPDDVRRSLERMRASLRRDGVIK